MFAAICFSLLGGQSIGSAQLAPEGLPIQQSQQVPAVISPVPPMGAPHTGGISAEIITPATTNRVAPNFASRGSTTGFAGRGLPGMLGGPPLISPLGAGNPSGRFMRPQTIGPLFCDPAVEFPC